MNKFIVLITSVTISAASFSASAQEGEITSESNEKGRNKAMFFEKKDLDNNGFISKEEFMKAGKHYGKMKKVKGNDKNGDGKISESEYIDAKKEKFKKMDSDGDGFLTAKEMAENKEKYQENRGNRKEKREEKMGNKEERFNQIDKNGDGKLSKEEIMEHHKSRKGKRKIDGEN